MTFHNQNIVFSQSDMRFVKRVGLTNAIRIVTDHYAVTEIPLIDDTWQLASLLGIPHKRLFSLVRSSADHYRQSFIQKECGGRIIYVPDEELSAVQRRILHEILEKHPVSPYATAYVRGRSLYDNASPHVKHRYLLKLDITDFFGSIRFQKVLASAFPGRYFSRQIGTILTTLCCREDVLPTGAPTSPALSNLVMKAFDEQIGEWCRRRRIIYTRYCDDMTFSADTPLYAVYQKVKTMLSEDGLILNEQKTHFVTNAARQSVTGLTVNEKVSVPRDYKRRLRQEAYYALRYPADRSDGYSQLLGKIGYVLQIEPENRWFRAAFDRLNCLKL